MFDVYLEHFINWYKTKFLVILKLIIENGSSKIGA